MTKFESITKAAEMLEKRVDGMEGHLGVLDAVLTLYGDYGTTLSAMSLLVPTITFEGGVPFARFPGAADTLPIDCFHVDLIHHSTAASGNPATYAAIGALLAESWSSILMKSGFAGHFVYDAVQGYDVVYRI
ncbi:hypothetical protein [Corallincola spongiicola]|uniref:Uncharacterized protein n=1 Tax=Corallincola spongiicola TaxID=2520508 RepID=A0ABY1WLD9_9GAMM|nr:hypothetical protein [Corallincola spongiicola]TAA41730.1 hypothetical protein EXY25_15930 [Corallincola spongiicola]